MFTVSSRNHIEMVTVKIFLAVAIPTDVAIGLGVETGMVTLSKALGAAITSRFTVRVSSGYDGRPIPAGRKGGTITNQSEASGNAHDVLLEEVK